MTVCINPKDVFQLARGDDDTGRRDETSNHRVRQEIGKKAQPQETQHQQNGARQKRQCNCSHDIFRGAGHRDLTDRRCGQQRYDRDRTNSKRATCAKNRIKHDRQH